MTEVKPQPPAWFNLSWDGEFGTTYVRPVYEMAGSVKYGHSLFHGKAFNRDNDWNIYDSNYNKQIAIYTGVCMAAGLIAFICLPIAYFVVARCQRCCAATRRKPLHESRLRYFFIASSGLGVASVILSLVGTVMVSVALSKTANELYSLSDAAATADELSNRALDDVNRTLSSITPLQYSILTCPNLLSNTTTEVQKVMADLQQAGQVLLSDAQLQIDSVNAIGLSESVSDIAGVLQGSKPLRITVIVLLFVVEVALIGIFGGLGWARFNRGVRANHGVRRSSLIAGCLAAPVAVLVVLLSWILFSVAIAVAMVVGDFCADPEYNSVFAVSHQSTTAGQLLYFYATCEGAQLPVEQVAEIQQLIQTVIPPFEKVLTPVATVTLPNVCPENVPAFNEASYAFWAALQLTWDTVAQVRQFVSCPTLAALYTSSVEDTMCHTLPRSIVVMLFGGLFTALFLGSTILLWRLLMDQQEARRRCTLIAADALVDGSSGHDKSQNGADPAADGEGRKQGGEEGGLAEEAEDSKTDWSRGAPEGGGMPPPF